MFEKDSVGSVAENYILIRLLFVVHVSYLSGSFLPSSIHISKVHRSTIAIVPESVIGILNQSLTRARLYVSCLVCCGTTWSSVRFELM